MACRANRRASPRAAPSQAGVVYFHGIRLSDVPLPARSHAVAAVWVWLRFYKTTWGRDQSGRRKTGTCYPNRTNRDDEALDGPFR